MGSSALRSLLRLRDTVPRVLADPTLCFALLILTLVVGGALLADWLAPYDPIQTNLRSRSQPPSLQYLLGTDEQGRDILSRTLYGVRITLITGLLGLLGGLAIGVPTGLLAGYFPKIDALLMRMVDVILSFPAILLGLAIAGAIGPGMIGIIVSLAVATVGPSARITRSAALTVVNLEFVVGARMVGLSNSQIMLRYILPNCLPALIVYSTLRFGQLILLGASLSFLGLGIAPPTPELGVMVSQGRSLFLTAPHIAIIPCTVILLIVLSFNIVGDALRDALDPQLKV